MLFVVEITNYKLIEKAEDYCNCRPFKVTASAFRLPFVPESSLMHMRCFSAILVKIISSKKGKGSPYSITERRVPELIPVLCSQRAGDVSHKPGGRLPFLPVLLQAVIHS